MSLPDPETCRHILDVIHDMIRGDITGSSIVGDVLKEYWADGVIRRLLWSDLQGAYCPLREWVI